DSHLGQRRHPTQAPQCEEGTSQCQNDDARDSYQPGAEPRICSCAPASLAPIVCEFDPGVADVTQPPSGILVQAPTEQILNPRWSTRGEEARSRFAIAER